jgi:hypothetical protein
VFNNPLEINDGATFSILGSFHKQIRGSIIIHSGGTMVISNSVVSFADTRSWNDQHNITNPTRILVEAGGKLIVKNGSVLKGIDACNNMWDGIQVQGKPDKPQNATDQGQVQVLSSTIKDARIGVLSGDFRYLEPSNDNLPLYNIVSR